MRVASVEQKRLWTARVIIGGYYTNGDVLIEAIDVNASHGTVNACDCSSEAVRCFGIEKFRAEFWLARGIHSGRADGKGRAPAARPSIPRAGAA